MAAAEVRVSSSLCCWAAGAWPVASCQGALPGTLSATPVPLVLLSGGESSCTDPVGRACPGQVPSLSLRRAGRSRQRGEWASLVSGKEI